MGTPGSALDFLTKSALEYYGLTFEDLERWGCKLIKELATPAAGMIADGTADGVFATGPIPSTFLMQLAPARELKLLPLSNDAVNYLVDKYGFEAGAIPAGAYDFVKEDVAAVVMPTGLFTRADFPEEAVYNVTRIFLTKKDYLDENTPGGWKDIFPYEGKHFKLHPGAERFYREQGWLK